MTSGYSRRSLVLRHAHLVLLWTCLASPVFSPACYAVALTQNAAKPAAEAAPLGATPNPANTSGAGSGAATPTAAQPVTPAGAPSVAPSPVPPARAPHAARFFEISPVIDNVELVKGDPFVEVYVSGRAAVDCIDSHEYHVDRREKETRIYPRFGRTDPDRPCRKPTKAFREKAADLDPALEASYTVRVLGYQGWHKQTLKREVPAPAPVVAPEAAPAAGTASAVPAPPAPRAPAPAAVAPVAPPPPPPNPGDPR